MNNTKLSRHLLHILIIEDNDTDVQIILGMLDKIIYQTKVFIVENGKDAIEFLTKTGKYRNRESAAQIDLILLDVHMPQMDGITFVQEIKKIDNLKKIPIIVFTTEKGMQDKFSIEGVNDYVIKSLDGSDLVRKINRYTRIST